MVDFDQVDRWADDLLDHIRAAAVAGHRSGRETFADFVDLSIAVLSTIGGLAAAVGAGQDLETVPDPAPASETYGSAGVVELNRGLNVLLRAAQVGYSDIIGTAYIRGDLGGANGQFFTPAPVAEFLALSVGDLRSRVQARIVEAGRRSPELQLLMVSHGLLGGTLSSGTVGSGLVFSYLARHVEPVRVVDPSCGSGILLLAAAATLPRWMVDAGLVRFHGCDNDPTCVKMAQLNFALHGLWATACCADTLAGPCP